MAPLVKFSGVLIIFALMMSTASAAPWDKSLRLKKMIDAYDINNTETVEGVVQKIYEITPQNSPNYGFHMIIKTERELLDIHLGPGWYLNKLDSAVSNGDVVQVTGARVKEKASNGNAGPRPIRAAEVKKGNAVVLKLRDKNGTPLWSGF